MHKFYWNNKQSARGGLNAASHGNAATTESVFDKPRHNAHQPMSESSKKGSAKMSHSKSEYNFNSIKNISGANISVHNQSNAAQCKITNSSQDYCDSINPELPKRSDGGIKTVVRVTSSPLKTDESSTKQQLTSSKSHSDMRGQLQSSNQHAVSNKHDESHANTAQSSNNKANKTPVGSHRVLLKLRRLSGKESRPKSVHGVEGLDSGKSGKNNSNDNKEANDQSDSVSLKGMSTSKSMHQFYFTTEPGTNDHYKSILQTIPILIIMRMYTVGSKNLRMATRELKHHRYTKISQSQASTNKTQLHQITP